MKILSKLKPEPGIWLSEAETPTIGSNDVLIKIKKTAICGTDLHIYKWDDWAQKTISVPMHIGHEFVGEIVDIGSDVKGFNIGDRVSGEGHITCGHCRNCRAGKTHLCRNTKGIGVHRPGCFAEYLAMPAFNVFKVPQDIPDDLVAIFDPFGNAVHTALSYELIGEDVLITGAGPVGLMAAAVSRFVGARHIVITDINDFRLNLAKKMGATLAMNVKDCTTDVALSKRLREVMAQLNMTEGYDIGLEMSGQSISIGGMLDTMNHGGKMALLGFTGNPVNINWDSIIWKGLFLKGIYGREMFETWYKMVALLQSGLDIHPVITHVMSVNDYQKAFEIMQSGQCGKVILDWESH